MTKKAVSTMLKRTFYSAVLTIGLAGIAVASAPQQALADDWEIDCFAPYDGCCACTAGAAMFARGAGGATNAGGGAYSCTKNAPKGKSLCESNGSEGRCGESSCGKDGDGEV